MKQIKNNHVLKIFSSILILISAFFLCANIAQAICPVCTIAVGAGVGLSRWLGVDDTISGLWIGGITVSVIWWTISWMEKKKIKFKGRKILVALGYYAIIVGPLYYGEIVGHPDNKLIGIDKLMLGIWIGSFLFLTGAIFHFQMKKNNGDKVFFPFQKVVFSISPLIVFSAVFYFLTKYTYERRKSNQKRQ